MTSTAESYFWVTEPLETDDHKTNNVRLFRMFRYSIELCDCVLEIKVSLYDILSSEFGINGLFNGFIY